MSDPEMIAECDRWLIRYLTNDDLNGDKAAESLAAFIAAFITAAEQRATAAERERCAGIVEAYGIGFSDQTEAGRAIRYAATMIRATPETPAATKEVMPNAGESDVHAGLDVAGGTEHPAAGAPTGEPETCEECGCRIADRACGAADMDAICYQMRERTPTPSASPHPSEDAGPPINLRERTTQSGSTDTSTTFDVPHPVEAALMQAEQDIAEGRFVTDEELRPHAHPASPHRVSEPRVSQYLPNDEVEQDVEARIRQDKPYVHDEDQIAVLAGMLSRLRDERQAHAATRRERDAIREREAACCPEDVPFDEYIRTLQARVAALEDALRKYGQHPYDCDTRLHQGICDCGLERALLSGGASEGRPCPDCGTFHAAADGCMTARGPR